MAKFTVHGPVNCTWYMRRILIYPTPSVFRYTRIQGE